MKTVTTVPFAGTEAQAMELQNWLDENKNTKGVEMVALQTAQRIYGYLPIEVQKVVADTLNVPLERIYGIATFYSQFRLKPAGKYKISVCLGTACYVKNAQKIFDKLGEILNVTEGELTEDGKFSLESCRCIGACGLAPVIMINDDVYGRLTGTELKGILEKY